jgi:hypothetical protein
MREVIDIHGLCLQFLLQCLKHIDKTKKTTIDNIRLYKPNIVAFKVPIFAIKLGAML